MVGALLHLPLFFIFGGFSMIINIKDVKEKVNALENEFEHVDIYGYYVYTLWSKPLQDGKKSKIEKDISLDKLIKIYNQYNNTSDLKYIALGIDYKAINCELPGSRDLCYEKLIS